MNLHSTSGGKHQSYLLYKILKRTGEDRFDRVRAYVKPLRGTASATQTSQISKAVS